MFSQRTTIPSGNVLVVERLVLFVSLERLPL